MVGQFPITSGIGLSQSRMTPGARGCDDNAESRSGTISAFNGVEPSIETFADPDREAAAVGEWLADCIAEGMRPTNRGRRAQQMTR